MNKSLIFFGNERLATGVTTSAPLLKGLINDGWPIKAVIVNNSEAHGRRKRKLEVAEIADRHEIPLLLSSEATLEKLKSFGAQAGILAAYGRMVPKELIDIFPNGIINIHPSLLPKYRGSTPIEQTVLDGIRETGVSLMSLVPKMDAGPVYKQARLELSGYESKQELSDKLGELGSRIMLADLGHILANSLAPVPQDDSLATYTKQLNKTDGVMDLRKPAKQLEREVRAFAGWPRSRTTVFGHEVIVTKARLLQSADDSALILECNPGLLEVIELIAPSGKMMTGPDFMRGYKK